ncbi:carbonic anhydrase [Jatrophihabitans sp. YIM 134969]
MTHLDDLLDRNAVFAATDARLHVPAIPFLPNRQAYVLTCIDPRVDPAAIFELDLGDAIVARTVGGRVNDGFLDDLAWISYLHEVKTPDAEWFELAVVHHTDCGSGLMADDDLCAGFVARGYDDRVLRDTAVVDPAATVRIDVAKILAAPNVSDRVAVSGYTYDVATGRVERVVDPRH